MLDTVIGVVAADASLKLEYIGDGVVQTSELGAIRAFGPFAASCRAGP